MISVVLPLAKGCRMSALYLWLPCGFPLPHPTLYKVVDRTVKPQEYDTVDTVVHCTFSLRGPANMSRELARGDGFEFIAAQWQTILFPDQTAGQFVTFMLHIVEELQLWQSQQRHPWCMFLNKKIDCRSICPHMCFCVPCAFFWGSTTWCHFRDRVFSSFWSRIRVKVKVALFCFQWSGYLKIPLSLG